MAPFNKRQIGYIQAIAGRQQHRTLIAGRQDKQLDSNYNLSTNPERKPKTFDPAYVRVPGSDTAPTTNSTDGVGCGKSLLLYTWYLDEPELGFDARKDHNDQRLKSDDFSTLQDVSNGMGDFSSLKVFDAAVKGYHELDHDPSAHPSGATATGELVRNPNRIASVHRATPDGYLNSTTLKFRFTLPTVSPVDLSGNDHPIGTDHYEFRWIVFRNKRPTMNKSADNDEEHTNLEAIRDGVSFRNPAYDLFMGQTGRKRGFLGYTLNPNLDQSSNTAEPAVEAYSGYFWDNASGTLTNSSSLVEHSDAYPDNEGGLTVDDVMTMPLNRDDYVVQKDVRFFLGKEQGKSHFEDTFHWDWNDPIDTPKDHVLSSPTLNNKNYRWHIMLLGTTNGDSKFRLNSSLRWTTKMESG